VKQSIAVCYLPEIDKHFLTSPKKMTTVSGQIIDLHQRKIYGGKITILDGMISEISPCENAPNQYILPGFIDAHIHIESSMLTPSEFARIAVCHGTVGTVSDPHEIANVLGKEGVYYMLDNAEKVPFHFYFGAPSCVPATTFESAGAVIDAEGIRELLKDKRIHYLAEMMNYPGVIHEDDEVMKKIAFAHAAKKPVDGHAPGLRGTDLDKYISAGISTDHESFTFEEGKEKLAKGMKILIREGSAAKNYAALAPLIPEHSANMMFCSDDKHPDDLILGHINQLVSRAVKDGYDLFEVLRMACINPIEHYNLNVGQLRKGDAADFIVVEDLTEFIPVQTFIKGTEVAINGKSSIVSVPLEVPNNFNISPISSAAIEFHSTTSKIRVIEALDGELITNLIVADATLKEDCLVSNPQDDILKIVVINRYKKAKPAIGFIKNFGLKRGAIGSTVAHDSHNIIVVGVDDESITRAANELIKVKGGIVAINEGHSDVLPLPIAGIMSNKDAWTVGAKYERIDRAAKQLGSKLNAPFMTLSFMGLLVIPALKMSDFGLFDGSKFQFVSVEADSKS
jgi:adenine deaminase